MGISHPAEACLAIADFSENGQLSDLAIFCNFSDHKCKLVIEA